MGTDYDVIIAAYLDNVTYGLAALLAAIAAVPTASEIQTEIEENAASLLDTIRDDLANGTDGLGALKALIDANKTVLDTIPTTMVGTNNAALASVLGALDNSAAAGAVTDADTAIQYLKQLVTAQQGNLSCLTFAGNTGVVVVTGTGADLDFPSVVVSGIPTGATLVRVTADLAVGSTFDTSAAENQIKTGTTDGIYVMKTGASWGSDDILAIPIPALAFETKASDYGAGGVVWGNTDIKGELDDDATYLFRSEETNRTKGVEATGGNLELHTVSVIVRVWYRMA